MCVCVCACDVSKIRIQMFIQILKKKQQQLHLCEILGNKLIRPMPILGNIDLRLGNGLATWHRSTGMRLKMYCMNFKGGGGEMLALSIIDE